MPNKRSKLKDRCLRLADKSLFCILLVLASSAFSATAQESVGVGPGHLSALEDNSVQLQEVIVTAERREQTLQKTPLSVSAVAGDLLDRTGVNAFVDVLRNVPNVQLQVVGNPGSPTTVAIRGIGTDGPGKQVSTLIYEDGINAYLLDNFFYDVDRVEVLRGPQGTLYGGTATGGAVNIITNNPTLDQFSGSATIEAGNYNLIHGQVVLNAPASDTLAFRVAANYLRYDQYSGSDGPPAKDALNARGKVLWEPTERFSMLVGAEYFGDEGLDRDLIFLDANSELTSKTRVPQTGSKDLSVTRYYADVNVDLGFGQLTYLPAIQYSELDQTYTTAATPPPSVHHRPEAKLLTQELRLSSGQASPVTWVAGFYYSDDQADPSDRIILPFGEIHIQNFSEKKQTAGYGQATLPLSSSWRLTGGVRYSVDEVDHPQVSDYPDMLNVAGDGVLVPFDKTYHRFDYLFRVEHDLSADSLLYASFSTGYRPGGLSLAGQGYDEESVDSFEVGSKSTLLNGSLVLNAAGYYYRYSGYQLANQIACGPGCLLFDIVSIPADYLGAELEMTYRLTPEDIFTLAPSYTDGHFTDDTVARPDIFTAPTLVATDGEEVPHAAKWRINGSYQHDFWLPNGGVLSGRAEAAYVSSQFTEFAACAYSNSLPSCAAAVPEENAELHTQPGYTLADLSLGYTTPDQRWSVNAYVRNLTDEAYKLAYLNGGAANVGPPRTYGALLSVRW